MAEFWLYDNQATPVAQQAVDLWYFDSNKVPLNISEMWYHDGVDFKLVYTQPVQTPAVVAQSPLYFVANYATFPIGIDGNQIHIVGNGHIDGFNPAGYTTSPAHQTALYHIADWYYPTQFVGNLYYFTIDSAVFEKWVTTSNAWLSATEITNTADDNALYLEIRDGDHVITSTWSGTNFPIDASAFTTFGTFDSATINLKARYRGQSLFLRRVTYNLNIHLVSDNSVVSIWPITQTIFWDVDTGGGLTPPPGSGVGTHIQ